jgi:hypothetical protein
MAYYLEHVFEHRVILRRDGHRVGRCARMGRLPSLRRQLASSRPIHAVLAALRMRTTRNLTPRLPSAAIADNQSRGADAFKPGALNPGAFGAVLELAMRNVMITDMSQDLDPSAQGIQVAITLPLGHGGRGIGAQSYRRRPRGGGGEPALSPPVGEGSPHSGCDVQQGLSAVAARGRLG